MATRFPSGITATLTGAVVGSTVSTSTSLTVGSSGTALTHIKKGTISVNPASLATVTAADTTLTITGAAVGDVVVLNPPAAGLTAGMLICGAWVSATDTVKLRLYNGSGGTIDEAAATWDYVLIRS